MCLITTSVDVKRVEMAHKSVVSPGLRSMVRVQINPFVLQCLVLCQIVEVASTLTRVASKEKDAIFKGQGVCA